jgi:hypothetical protein
MSKKTKGGGPHKFENSFKVAVARDYLTGSLGMGTVGKKYNLSGEQVRTMVNWYKERYPDGGLDGELPQEQPRQQTPDELAKALHLANLKIAGLEIMIEIASKELGVDIRKKPGAKQ